MSFYQISSRELRSSSENLETLLQRFKSEKENLATNEINLNQMWDGEARNSFHQAFLRDMGQMDSFIEIIENYVRVMESIADRYDTAEAKNMGIATNRTY